MNENASTGITSNAACRFRERLTGLAAAAFRALKEGQWSAESAANLSNDEFFEIIGIPELTTGPDPLIRKRDGCHVWKPETFSAADPRHGWTWDHCWQDAVTLLGSEEAVRQYIAGPPPKPVGHEAEPFQLKRERANSPQKRLF